MSLLLLALTTGPLLKGENHSVVEEIALPFLSITRRHEGLGVKIDIYYSSYFIRSEPVNGASRSESILLLFESIDSSPRLGVMTPRGKRPSRPQGRQDQRALTPPSSQTPTCRAQLDCSIPVDMAQPTYHYSGHNAALNVSDTSFRFSTSQQGLRAKQDMSLLTPLSHASYTQSTPAQWTQWSPVQHSMTDTMPESLGRGLSASPERAQGRFPLSAPILQWPQQVPVSSATFQPVDAASWYTQTTQSLPTQPYPTSLYDPLTPYGSASVFVSSAEPSTMPTIAYDFPGMSTTSAMQTDSDWQLQDQSRISYSSSSSSTGHPEDATATVESNRGRQKRYGCSVCSFSSPRRSSRDAHVRTHSPRKRDSKIMCDYNNECTKIFNRKTDLQRHIDSVSCSTTRYSTEH